MQSKSHSVQRVEKSGTSTQAVRLKTRSGSDWIRTGPRSRIEAARPLSLTDDTPFHPELMDWQEPHFGEPPVGTPDGIAIYDGEPEDSLKCREWLFTIVVNPAFSQTMADRIALLISRAPELWRELRQCASIIAGDEDNWSITSSAIESLMYAASCWPFEHLHPNKEDEDLMRKAMEKRQAIRLANIAPARRFKKRVGGAVPAE